MALGAGRHGHVCTQRQGGNSRGGTASMAAASKRAFSEGVPFVQAPDIDSDVFVEVLGCLATLSIPGFDWQPIIVKHDLVHFLTGLRQICTECSTPQCSLRMHGQLAGCWAPM